MNAIATGLGLENIKYEPEQFPGLVYRLSDPKVVILLFGSGKLVVTGGKKPEDMANAVDRIVEGLNSLSLLAERYSLNQGAQRHRLYLRRAPPILGRAFFEELFNPI